MPELPEAETIVRGLRAALEGQRIASAEFFAKRVSPDDPDALSGRRIRAVKRYGKQVLIDFEDGAAVLVKLGMTGALRLANDQTPYTRARLNLDSGATLLFDDIRQFGSLRLIAAPPAKLGPDPLEITADDFVARLRARDTQLKRLLLDQTFLRGIGNIYADEALFRAGIHPKARTRRLSAARARALHEAVVRLLQEAIELRGSSVSDYVDAEGKKGGFQLLHNVYRKHGQPCPRCGHLIARTVIGQRGTHYCPACQKA